MKRILESGVVTIGGILLSKAIDRYGINIIEEIYRNFFADLWFVWFGIAIGATYWFVRFLITLNRSTKSMVNYNEIVDKTTKAFNDKLTVQNQNFSSLVTKLNEGALKLPTLFEKQIAGYEKQTEALTNAMKSYDDHAEALKKYIDAVYQRVKILEERSLR